MAPSLLGFSFRSASSKINNRSPLLIFDQTKGMDLSVAVCPSDVEGLRSINLELQRQLEEQRKLEEVLRAELEQTRKRLARMEEAEEFLCSQLGDLEAEAVQQTHAHNRQLNVLKEQLRLAENLLADARAQLEHHP